MTERQKTLFSDELCEGREVISTDNILKFVKLFQRNPFSPYQKLFCREVT